MRKLGWIAWCLTVVDWFLSPIISLLVNKIFVYLVFNTSKKLKELENETIPKLKQTLGVVEEQTVLRAAEDKGSQSNLKILDSMKKDLKSGLYEAEDILDLLDYRRIEKDLHLGDDDSRWVENQLGAACAWIARCKGSSFGRWIHVTLAAVMKRAQSMTRQGQLLIQGWRHSRQNFERVFGRDKDRAHICRMLREGQHTYAASSGTSKPYSVIGIYGITGSGKSTLAQYVCDHEKYAGHFNLIMFVLVGKTFSVGNIFRDMLEQITQSQPSKDNDLESLKAELKKELKDKCFWLVLDDVWVNSDNTKERRILLDVLLVGQSGSRILVTAQKTDGAAALGAR